MILILCRHHPRTSLKSSAKKSTSRRSTTGTSKMDVLIRLQRYLKQEFDGRLEELQIDDLHHYSVQNGQGSCHVKCPICEKLTKVPYRKYGNKRSYWISSEVAKHLRNTHRFK